MDIKKTSNTICRTCLHESVHVKSIFTYEYILEERMFISDILMLCANIVITQGDGLPENICWNCSLRMNTTILFRKLCEKSNKILKDAYINKSLENVKDELIKVECTDLKLDQSELQLPTNRNHYLEEFNQTDKKLVEDQSRDNIDCINEEFIKLETSNLKLEKRSKRNFIENTDPSVEKGGENDDLSEGNNVGEDDITDNENISSQANTNVQCDHCEELFLTRKMLHRHKLKTHSNLQEEKVKDGNETGIIKQYLPTTCDVCNKTFTFHSNLERHKLTHSGEKPFLCNFCGKGFAQLCYLKIHSFIHTGEKPYQCQLCDKSFSAPGTLSSHVRTHTGERLYACKICGKEYTQSGYLSVHMRSHTGERPVQCKLCNKTFDRGSRLKTHMRSHSGEKPYQCSYCGRGFAVNGTLKKHIRTHTGERPYVCSICSQSFAQTGTLATHMKIHKPKD